MDRPYRGLTGEHNRPDPDQRERRGLVVGDDAAPEFGPTGTAGRLAPDLRVRGLSRYASDLRGANAHAAPVAGRAWHGSFDPPRSSHRA